MAAFRVAVLMAVAVATAWADVCTGKSKTLCTLTMNGQCTWDSSWDRCEKNSCSKALLKSQCTTWKSATESKNCKWDDNRCYDPTLEDLATGLATFVIILIVISVLIVIAIIACIVCCCCMGAKAVSGGRNETVVVTQQPPPHAQAYQQM